MANLTKYSIDDYWSETIDLMEIYYIYKTKFKQVRYLAYLNKFVVVINDKRYYFNYKAESSFYDLGGSNRKYSLLDETHGISLYANLDASVEIENFLERLRKEKVYQCLPLRFLRTLLQILYVKPVGWMKTNLETGER